MMQRQILLLTGGLLINLMIWGQCSRQRPPAGEHKTIVFWHSFVATSLPALQDCIREFEQTYPRIRIKSQYVPTGDALIQKLITAIHSQTTPDVAWVHADFLDKLIAAEAIYPLQHFIARDSLFRQNMLPDILPQLLRAASWRDTLYALPLEATTLMLLYNRDLFRKAGLEPDHPPNTWEELCEYTERLTRDFDADGKFDQYGFYVPVFPSSGALSIWMMLQWEPFLWQAGGDLMNSDLTRFEFNSAAGLEAVSLWRELYRMQRFERFSQAHDMGFISQTVAMIMDGPWNLPRYRKSNSFDWGVAPLPAGPAGRATYLAGEQLVIFKESDCPEQAWTFMRWFLRPDVQSRFARQSGYLPVTYAAFRDSAYRAYLDSFPQQKAYSEQLSAVRGRQLPARNRIEINQRIARALEAIIRDSADPQETLDQAATDAARILRSY